MVEQNLVYVIKPHVRCKEIEIAERAAKVEEY